MSHPHASRCRDPGRAHPWPVLAALALLTGCSQLPERTSAGAAPAATSAATPAPAPAPAPPLPLLPYDQAVLSAATAVLGSRPATAPTAVQAVVIDPLIDGLTGHQTVATQALGAQLAALVRAQYPQYQVMPFTAANVARSPLVLIGTFTGINAQRQAAGSREAYRLCFALADLRTGKLVGKGLAFARADGVDATPLAAFRDAPAWTEDPATQGYIRTCQGTRTGDPINPAYVERIVAAAQVAEAIDAYDAGRYQVALDLYNSALRTSAGDQFRVYNGLYLTLWKLGHRERAEAAFARIVDYGLAQRRLAVKFLFRPGSTAFVADSRLSAPYPLWVRTVATRAASAGGCLEVVGHTSATGPEPLNDRLSQARAEALKALLEASAPALGRHLIASGMGSRQMMVGTGRDDASDALDRRVEFKVIGC